jgi:hypothetical protein
MERTVLFGAGSVSGRHGASLAPVSARSSRSVAADVVGREVGEPEVAEAHQHRRDPAAECAEVLVEQRVGAVGERLLGELVEPLVGDLDRVLDGAGDDRRRTGRGGRSRR